MDHSAGDFLEDDNAEAGTRDKPCRTCRRRKVRCSKTEPCNNCQRANIVCEYDDDGQSSNSTSSRAAQGLARRISELEALVRRYQEQSNSAGSGRAHGTAQGLALIQSTFAAERILHEVGSNDQTQQEPQNSAAQVSGKLLIHGSMSRHVLSTFWGSMYEEASMTAFVSLDCLAHRLSDRGSQVLASRGEHDFVGYIFASSTGRCQSAAHFTDILTRSQRISRSSVHIKC